MRYIVFCILVFCSCSIHSKLDCGEAYQAPLFSPVDPAYTLHVFTSQGCGHCSLLMNFLKNEEFCGNSGIRLIVYEYYFQHFPERDTLPFLNHYPTCAEVRLSDDCTSRVTKVFPVSYLIKNSNSKIVNKFTGFSRSEFEKSFRELK